MQTTEKVSSKRTTLTVDDSRRVCSRWFRQSVYDSPSAVMWQKYSYLLSSNLCPIIFAFADWVPYPKGNHSLEGHTNVVTCAVVSSDGLSLFTGAAEKDIIHWDLITNEMIHKWEACLDVLDCMDYHSDGLLASSEVSDAVKVWNVDDYSVRTEIKFWDAGWVVLLQFHPSGDYLFTANRTCNIVLFSIETGECIREFTEHQDSIIRFFPVNNDCLLSISDDLTTRVWDVNTAEVTRTFTEDIDYTELWDLSMNSDQSLLAKTDNDYVVFLKWPELEEVDRIELGYLINARFHPRIPHVLFTMTDTCVRIHDIRKGKEASTRVIQEFDKPPGMVSLTPDGTRLILLSEHNTVTILDCQ